MSKKENVALLKKLILSRSGRGRLQLAWVALCSGMILLLLAIMVWWNFHEILKGRNNNDSLGSTFLTISKNVTNENMGAQHTFSVAEIDALKKAPEVEDVGALIPATFRTGASMGGALNFYTEMFLEAVPDRFMDKTPEQWYWEEGSTGVPIIVSGDFLNLYNYGFAPGQGLPQLSEETIKTIGFRLDIGNGEHQQRFTGHVAGFSDRINSVLVPEAFMKYANTQYGNGTNSAPSRLIIKAKDPSSSEFSDFLRTHDYVTNSELLRWNKVRAVIDVVSGATGVLAIVLLGISALVFILFIELTLARSRPDVQLLLEIGYSPKNIGSFLEKRFIPVMLSAVIIALMVAVILQIIFRYLLIDQQLTISILPGWPVFIIAALCLFSFYVQIRNTVRKALRESTVV